MLCFSLERFGADVSSLSPSSEQTLDQQGLIWYVFRRKVWLKADVSSVSPSSEQTLDQQGLLWYVFHPRGLVYSRRLERSPQLQRSLFRRRANVSHTTNLVGEKHTISTFVDQKPACNKGFFACFEGVSI